MPNSRLQLVLPYERQVDGFPSPKSLLESKFSFFGAVLQEPIEAFAKLVASMKVNDVRITFYDDEGASFGTFPCGATGVVRWLEDFSIFNVCVSATHEAKYLFLSGDGGWIVCFGDSAFVLAARATLEIDLEAVAAEVADASFYSDESRDSAIDFIRDFSHLNSN